MITMQMPFWAEVGEAKKGGRTFSRDHTLLNIFSARENTLAPKGIWETLHYI